MIHYFRTSRSKGGNKRIRQRAMAAHSTVFFVVFIALYQADSVFSCTVTPPAAAALAGNSVSFTCTPIAGVEYINSWRRQNTNKAIYTTGSDTVNRTVAGGYSVDDSDKSQIKLTVNELSIQYIDNYECICTNTDTGVSKGSAYISVIDSEPQFNSTDSLSIDEPVKLTCLLKFSGDAWVLMRMTNSAGEVHAELNRRITTNDLQQLTVSNTTSSAFEKIYFCNISLANDSSDPKTTIFNRTLTRTVQFSVRNVSFSQQSCNSAGFCEKNTAITCNAEGSPGPSYNVTVYYNGTKESFSTDKYTFKYVGQQVIQCTAFNVINGVVYSKSSNFTANVTENSIFPETDGDSKTSLIVGLVVGLGGGLILILIIIVIIIYFKRQKRRTACCNLEQSSEAKPEDAIETKDVTKGNKGNNTNTYGQTNLAATSGDERVLVDNTLYSGAKGGVTYTAAIDPSAPVFLYRNHRFPQPDHVTMYHLRTAASVPVAQYGHQFSQFQPGYFYARQHY